ncbi:MAG: sugar phosphate isomerase/epimerase family protein [Rhodothermia bacterium]
MKRRKFIQHAPAALALPVWATQAIAAADGKLDRIACTTVSFRHRFPATQPKGGVTPAEPNLELLDVPAFFAEHLGFHNVEVWSKHFTEQTPAYAQKLRAAAQKVGSRIINVQVDEPPFDLSSSNAAERAACIKEAKRWMDLAAACGAPSMRANTGGRRNEPFDLGTTADSFRQLAEYGESLGVRVLVENHGGHSARAENVAAIVKAVASPWCRSLPDFGNTPQDFTIEQRVAFLEQILPDAHLISAKGMEFDGNYKHTTYDIAPCVRAARKAGFAGIYSIELWAPKYVPPDPLKAVQALVRTIQKNM